MMKRLRRFKSFLLSQNPKVYGWAVLILFIFPVSFIKIYDCDIWWHIQLGRSMLENMDLPDYTRFYFTPVNVNYSDLRYTWLGDIFFYVLHYLGKDLSLQLLVVAVVILSCYLLYRIAGPKFNAWHLLTLMLFVIGTFQKQLIRNSLFALVFTTLIFWLWWQVRYRGKEKKIWFFPVLMGVWGCIHGSYLLGFGVMALIFAGDWIDTFRGINQGRKKLTFHYGIVTLISFILIVAYNPMTIHYFRINQLKQIFSQGAASKKVVYSDDDIKKDLFRQQPEESILLLSGVAVEGVFKNVKTFLNTLIFQQDKDILPSGDFRSPFDCFYWLYVKVSFFMGLMGLLFLTVFSKPVRCSHLLPFLAILVVGSGYARTVGYIPVAATSAVFITARNEEFSLKISDQWAKWIAGLALIAVYVNLATGYKVPIGTDLHIFGIGRIPTYADESAHKILTDFPEKKVFNTIMNGGYLLYKWYPEKKVFIDGFFAPHPYSLFLDYGNCIKGKTDPDVFHKKYGVELAVIDQIRRPLHKQFLKSDNWHARFIDQGSVVYGYQPDDTLVTPTPAILTPEQQILKLPVKFRTLFARNLLMIQNDMVKKGRLKDIHLFRKEYAKLIRKMENLMVEESKTLYHSIDYYTGVYGTVNSKTISDEIGHNKAFKDNRYEKAVHYGIKVLEKMPERVPVLVNLSEMFSRNKDVKNSIEYLDRAWAARKKDPGFWSSNRFNIARLCLKLSSFAKKNGQLLTAYRLLSRANRTDSSVISNNKLYDIGIEFARKKASQGQEIKAYEILKQMEIDFSGYGRFHNQIAWYILSNKDTVFDGPEAAKKYAEKAIRLMKKNNDPDIDTAYHTMAEACYQLGEYDRMREFEQKALAAAPDGRKNFYQPRSVKDRGNK